MVLVLNQGERERGGGGDKRKEDDGYRSTHQLYRLLIHISRRFLACQREKKIQFGRSEFCEYYSVQVGQCTT